MKSLGSLSRAWVRGMALAAAVAAVAGQSVAEDLKLKPPVSSKPADVPMQTILWDSEKLAEAQPNLAEAIPRLKQDLGLRYIDLTDSGKVHVEIIGPEGGAALDEAVIAPFGGEVSNSWRHRVDAYIPVENLTEAARALPPGYFMERADVPGPDAVGGEGATAINSDSYRDGGADGSGLTIGVIDGGYFRFTTARNAGDAPPAGQTTLINYTPNSFESGTNQHGTACVEAAFDHAPDANYRIYKIDSLTDMGTAVTNGIANGVDIWTHSLSRYNTGWADNTGDACAAALDAAQSGAVFFTSAGNRAQQHWQGNFNAGPDADQWHDWVSGDETNEFTISDDGGGNFYLAWNTSGGTYNYDLYLYDSDLTTVLASSTNGGNTYESFGYTNTSGATKTVHLSVRRVSGGTTEFETFFHESSGSGNFEYQTASSSTTSPSNLTQDVRVVSCGAVAQNQFNNPNGTSGILASYSSRGPSNSGTTLPDLVGPTNTNTTAYSGTFGGTSCATPNTAGAACAFWSADTLLSGATIRWLMQEQSDLWRDWGAAGNDNLYGRGGAILTDYAAGTIWVARQFGNFLNGRSSPFYTVQAAYDAVPSGGRLLVFPGGNYPETVSMTGTKYVNVQTLENPANLGF